MFGLLLLRQPDGLGLDFKISFSLHHCYSLALRLTRYQSNGILIADLLYSYGVIHPVKEYSLIYREFACHIPISPPFFVVSSPCNLKASIVPVIKNKRCMLFLNLCRGFVKLFVLTEVNTCISSCIVQNSRDIGIHIGIGLDMYRQKFSDIFSYSNLHTILKFKLLQQIMIIMLHK